MDPFLSHACDSGHVQMCGFPTRAGAGAGAAAGGGGGGGGDGGLEIALCLSWASVPAPRRPLFTMPTPYTCDAATASCIVSNTCFIQSMGKALYLALAAAGGIRKSGFYRELDVSHIKQGVSESEAHM